MLLIRAPRPLLRHRQLRTTKATTRMKRAKPMHTVLLGPTVSSLPEASARLLFYIFFSFYRLNSRVSKVCGTATTPVGYSTTPPPLACARIARKPVSLDHTARGMALFAVLPPTNQLAGELASWFLLRQYESTCRFVKHHQPSATSGSVVTRCG